MNVIKQPWRGGRNPGSSRLVASAPQKAKGRGRGALDFDLIQYRPGQRGTISTSSSSEGRTPSNLQLQMAISSSAHRNSSSSLRTESGNNLTTPSSAGFGLPTKRTNFASTSTSTPQGTSSSSTVTPRFRCMPPPKTPRYSVTPKGSMIVSSTPRTTPSSNCDQNSYVVLAVTEGRGHARGEVGIAVIDIKRPRLILCQLSDRQTYINTLTKISVFQPLEILVPNTFVESNQPNKLYNLLEEKFPFVSMTKVQRRLFRDSEGLEKVQSLCLPEHFACQLILKDRFYALAAAAALLRYVEFVQNVIFAPRSLKVDYQGAHDGTIIDVKTATNLELLLNQQSNNGTHTLVGIMDHCCTHGGSRMLRASLLHPPCSLPLITRRQDGVQELVENVDMGQKIREVLQQLPDVEQLLTLCMQTPSTIDNTPAIEKRVNYVIMLKRTLETLPLLTTALENAHSVLLLKAKERLQDSRGDQMKARISQTINDDVKDAKKGKTASFQRCFAVKSGVNDLLDVSRKTYSELINDMFDHVTELGENHSLPLKMDYSVTRGYHILITIQKNHPVKKSDLPSAFVQVHQNRSSLTCTTDILIHANERIKHVTNDILTLSNSLLTVVLNDIRMQMGYLYEMCESIAEVDLISAMAVVSQSHNYVRPQFGDFLSLKASRHPVLESITSYDLIANDIDATSWQSLTIITGPNMSGKSIYIRQLLLLQIMAQVGCYVPANEATFRITDRIFSHLNFDDSIENNASTLALEMQEMQLLLSSITATSLVALDELCRGTSVEEGTAIAWALCEKLSQATAFVFVTTHFRELTKLASLYPCIKNVHLEAVENEFSDKKSRLVYTHRLMPGPNTVEGYGIRLAESLNVPTEILDMARNFSTQIRINSEMNLTSGLGDENYILALGFHKLKDLALKEDLCEDDLISLRSELREKLRAAELERTSASAAEETSPETHTVPVSRKAREPPEQQKLCDYSSSEVESPMEEPVPPRDSGKSLFSESRPRYFRPGQQISKSQTDEDPRFDTPRKRSCISVVESNDDNISTMSSFGCDRLNSTMESPASASSFCSHKTWVAETPKTLSIQMSGSVVNRTFRDDSDMEIGNDSAFDREGSESCLADGTCKTPIILPSDTSAIGEKPSDREVPSLCLNSEKKPIGESVHPRPREVPFYFMNKDNTFLDEAIINRDDAPSNCWDASNYLQPSEFLFNNPSEKKNYFGDLLKHVATQDNKMRKKLPKIIPAKLSSKRTHDFDEDFHSLSEKLSTVSKKRTHGLQEDEPPALGSNPKSTSFLTGPEAETSRDLNTCPSVFSLKAKGERNPEVPERSPGLPKELSWVVNSPIFCTNVVKKGPPFKKRSIPIPGGHQTHDETTQPSKEVFPNRTSARSTDGQTTTALKGNALQALMDYYSDSDSE